MTDDKRKYTKEEKKTIKPPKEMSSAEDGNTYHKREKNDKAIGSLDTFITQAIKEPPPELRAGEQGVGKQFFKGVGRVKGGHRPAGDRK